MTKYLKVMFDKKSSANSKVEYRIDEVNTALTWNPKASDPKEMGGFNFSTETKIFRWLIRGDTIYDVELPEDAKVVECESISAPHGVFRTNKIIIRNPRPVTDDMAMDFYLKSELPDFAYYKALAGCAIRGYRNTCLKLIEERVNENNIDEVLSEIDDFTSPYQSSGTADNGLEVYNEIMNILNDIKSHKTI